MVYLQQTPMTVEEKIEQHEKFLDRENTDRPLIGLISGWENISRYVPDTESFFPKGNVKIEDLHFDRFLPMYRRYAKTLSNADVIFNTITPLPFFPWTEAAMGCCIRYTGKNFWSTPIAHLETTEGREAWIQTLSMESASSRENRKPWLSLYGDFIKDLTGHFSDDFPVSQTILRGPLDIAAAVLGDESMIYLFFDEPEFMKKLLSAAAGLYLEFVKIHETHLFPFSNGKVIGQYGIWTPGNNLRHQEDAMALLSPDLYREFVHPHDCTIAARTPYSLFHLHSSGMHLLDILLENEDIRIFQVSKDEGVDIETILPGVQKIQDRERCLIVKGRFRKHDAEVLRKVCNPKGLCIQAVIINETEADDFCSVF